jgi:hypothetical protein
MAWALAARKETRSPMARVRFSRLRWGCVDNIDFILLPLRRRDCRASELKCISTGSDRTSRSEPVALFTRGPHLVLGK